MRGTKGPVTLRLQAPTQKTDQRPQETSQRSVRVRDAVTGGELLEARLTAEEPTAQVPEGVERLRVALEERPTEAALRKPYPNPAGETVTLKYALPEAREITIAVYDVLGRRVARLVDGPKEAGIHQASLAAGRLPSGTYFVRMQTDGVSETRRLVVVK
jgi:hypothetical protein